ncbi:tape measure protein [uncultured Bacteroides sp.]|jgi:tape measure domain-containing protein|uniref:tape measure protein n=1 Tax=uncultured Bacteroides sp. TaxID=162156 RepID=UPI00280AC698|nr:tape measure protein [uncultured Bacteroides sp.]
MATLYFKVSSDYDEVIRLRKECEKLEAQLKKMDVNKSPAAAKALETQLASARQQMMGLVTEAAKAGAVMENDLKKKLNSASKASDELTEEIIKQRKIIRDTQDDVRRLSDEYSKMGKYSPNSKAKLAELNRAKAALNEQRYSLGELQDQQARNRLEVRKLTREYKEFSSGTNNADEIVKSLTDSLKRTAVEIGGLVAIKKFGSDVIEATGKMQQLQVALSTILQDKSKADQLIADIVQFAAKTPFNLDDVATGAKQLLAYGSSADNVVNELSMLGDVASGLQIPIGQLIYLYGTLRTQGRAMTVDIRQFAGRGIPIYEELAKVLGVSKDQVSELVKEGKVGFKEVEQAFKNMTSEGGKFANLMESSAGTWPQRLSNIEDTLFQKMNEFGNKYKEVFEFGIGTAEDLVESLDDVLSVMGGLIAAYGTYKAALITAAVAQKAVGFVESIRLIVMYRKELGLATAAQQAFNVASKSNVYVALLATLVGIGTAIYMYTKRTNEATVAQETLNSVNKKADEEFSKQAATVDRLSGVLKSETSSLDQKKKALSDLQAIIPSYNASLDEEGRLINNNTEAIKSYLTQLEKQIRMKAAQEELEELYRKKRVQEKDYKSSQENFERVKKENPLGEFYGESGARLQLYTAQERSSAEKKANKAKEALDETISAINALEKEIEESSLSDKKESPQSTISKEVENATKRIKTLKKEIADLRSGKLQAETGKTVESAIKAKEKELQSAEKTLETLTGVRNKDVSRENATTSAGGKLSDLERKQALERAKEAVELENQVEQARINAMADGREKILAQRELDNKKELQAIDRAKEEYIQKEVQRQKEIFEATEELKAKQNPKYKKKSFESSSVTVDTSMFDSIYDNTKNKQVNDRLKDEIEANERYLKNYGTFMQKRQAITDEYARKISEATTQGDKDILQKEMEKALSSLDLEKLKQGINWELVFGDLDKVSKESLNKVKQQLRDFKNSEEYKNMAVDQKKVIDEALNNIQSSLIDKGGLLADLPEQLSELAKAQEELSQAQEEYNEAMKNGTDAQKEAATKKLNDAQKRQQNAQTNVQKSTDKTTSNLIALSNVITQLGSNSEMSLSQVGSLAGNIVDIFADGSEKLGGIIGAAFSLLDAISSQGLDGFVDNLFGSVFRAVGGIWDTLTFGLIGNKESDPYLKDDLEKLTISNQDLKASLDNLAEKMDESSVADATGLYEQQKKNIEEQMANTKEMMQRSAAAYSNGFLGIGGTHSSNKKINDAMSAEDWKRVSDAAGVSVTSASDFWNLTSEQMYNVANNATDLYSKIKQYADDGYQNASQYMDSYIEYWKQLDELEDTYREKLTDTSFDNIRDEFKSQLLDMESDAEDFAENFEKMMQQAVVESMMSDTYASRLKTWYKSFANSMTDGTLSGSEQSDLKSQWDQMVSDALAERNAIMQAMGWEGSSSEQQSASSRGFGTEMTHEDAGELSGRFTAVYESNLRIEEAEQQQTVAITELRGSISALTVQATGMYNIADETRTILANSYLELQQIRENTGEIVKPIKQIQADIAEVKRNTARL